LNENEKTNLTCFNLRHRYHCYYEEPKNEYDPKEEYEFEEKAKMYLASFEAMKKKYQHLLMKQSQV
jgi:hypothetical protein